MKKALGLFESLYQCIRRTTLGDPYKAADETYYKILVPEKNSKRKGVRKGYLWVVMGINTEMIYLLYDDGSRSERVILNKLGSCKGIIQSDGYSTLPETRKRCLSPYHTHPVPETYKTEIYR